MRRAGVALVALAAACGVDLPLRDDVAYTCKTDRDCPLELACATLVGQCVAALDDESPRLTGVTATSRDTVVLTFDEAVAEAVASLASAYTFVRDDGVPLTVEAAAPLADGKSVVLRTARQRGGAVYTVATAVTDAQGNPALLDVQTFLGFGEPPDRAAPEVTAPANGAVIVVPVEARTAPRVTLAWTRGRAPSTT